MRFILLTVSACAMIALFSVYSLDQTLSDPPEQAMITHTRPAMDNGTSARFRKSADGHVRLTARVDGRSLPFLVDTGASTVVLSESSARQAGYKPFPGDFTYQVMTANGSVRGALVMLRDIEIEGIRLDNIRAIILPDTLLGTNLLGMSFLGRLQRFEMTPDFLLIEE
jgi:aspartyl protease family protein